MRLGLPQRPDNEAGDSRGCKRRHWLVLEGLVERAFEVARHFLHAFTGLAALIGHAVGDALGLVRRLAELLARLILDIGDRVRTLTPVRALCHEMSPSGEWMLNRTTPQRRFGSYRQARASPMSSAILSPRTPIGFLPPSVVSLAVWCSISAFISAPKRTMIIESHIQTMKPMTAPSDP